MLFLNGLEEYRRSLLLIFDTFLYVAFEANENKDDLQCIH